MLKKIIPILFLVAALSRTHCFAQYVITTIAGKTAVAYTGDGGPAVDAVLNGPAAICVSDDGVIYFADAIGHVVRKIDPHTCTISRVAGTGHAGFSGDGGPAVNAQVDLPQGIALDRMGNIYISDRGNSRIRKITTDGIINTIVGIGQGYIGDGMLAINTRLNLPCGIHLDSSGRFLYIADHENDRVRVVDFQTGIIQTLAGKGSPGGYSGDGGLATNAKLDGPMDVFLDHSGNLLIADQWNGSVRKVNLATNIITTFAGDGTPGYAGDGKTADSARFEEPSGLFVDKANNVYVCAYRNGNIRKIDAVTNIITTVVGGFWGFGGDGGPPVGAKLRPADVWLDTAGNFYIADFENHRLRKVYDTADEQCPNLRVHDIAGEAVRIFPNPTKGKLTIETGGKGEYEIEIVNLLGQNVFRATVSNTFEVDLSKQPSGLYLAYIHLGQERWMEKIVLNK